VSKRIEAAMSWIIAGILFGIGELCGIGLVLAPLVLRLAIYAGIWAAIILIPLGLLIGLIFGGLVLMDIALPPGVGGGIVIIALFAFGIFWYVKQKEINRYWRKQIGPHPELQIPTPEALKDDGRYPNWFARTQPDRFHPD
jgi:hypothetical protein